jgi:hypothetical protein
MEKTICIFKARVSQLPFWDPDSIHTGIPGSEEAIIYSSEELKNLGFKVVVLNNTENKAKYADLSANPRYAGYLHKNHFFDYTILHEDPKYVSILRERTKKLYLFPNNPCHRKFSEEEINALDGVLWLSSYQRNQWISLNPSLAKFTEIFGYGIQASQFQYVKKKNNPYSCIYASDYSRGLSILLRSWPKIKKHFPLATLDIYYGLRNWNNMSLEEESFIRNSIQDFKSIGVTDHGQVGHFELAKAFSLASLWTYPCTCPETFCITAMKAQLGGAIPVIIEKAALAETVKSGFKCMEPNQYENLLLQVMEKVEIFSQEEREKMGHFILENFTWQKMTAKWAKSF